MQVNARMLSLEPASAALHECCALTACLVECNRGRMVLWVGFQFVQSFMGWEWGPGGLEGGGAHPTTKRSGVP